MKYLFTKREHSLVLALASKNIDIKCIEWKLLIIVILYFFKNSLKKLSPKNPQKEAFKLLKSFKFV